MATKKSLSLLQQQKLKLKKQRALATTSRAKALLDRQINRVQVRIVDTQKLLKASPSQNALPPSSRGGDLATTKGPRRRNVTKNPPGGTQMGTKGSARAQLKLPPASIKSAGATSKALSAVGKAAGRIALPLAAYSEGKDLVDSLRRGEGYARVPGLLKKVVKGSGENKTSNQKTNSRGRRTSSNSAPSTAPTKKKGMSNIPPSEGTGKGSPNDKLKVTSSRSPASKVSPTAPTKTKPTAPTKTKPKGKRDYGSKEKNLDAWAKANPDLAIRLEEQKKRKAKKRAGGTLYSGRTGMSKIG